MKAKKSLGQHFLKSESALQKIVIAGNLKPGDFVVEIGPGQGVLTEYLLRSGSNVLAIEKDKDMIKELQKKSLTTQTTSSHRRIVASEKLTIFHKDILDLDTNNLPTNYKVIANIPYYITGAIIEKFLSSENQPEQMVLLVQKEVADRIVAKDGKESLLSIATKIYCQPKYIKTVKAGSFSPPPKVDSAIISLENISRKNFLESKVSEEKFFKILKAGFVHKRKRLYSNLKSVNLDDLDKKFERIGLDKNIRAEDLSLKDWINLNT